MFNEKTEETIFTKEGQKKVPVWQSPKYLESKQKALEIIKSEKYDVKEGDFWILMNQTKGGDKMAYTGLIISHNGCLKINDHLGADLKFKPEYLKNGAGYNDSLIYEYNCPEQGLYEVGEVSVKNCKNDYPYAMAFKRCFDRVVLKNSKLAYYGVYSDSEAEEFKERFEAPQKLDADLVAELKELGETLEVCATYYKTTVDNLTNEDLQDIINLKKANLKAVLYGTEKT